MLVDFGKANLVDKARQQPEKVRMVLDKVRTDGLMTTVDAVRSKLAQPMPLGYCNAGVVVEVGTGIADLKPGDRVASNVPLDARGAPAPERWERAAAGRQRTHRGRCGSRARRVPRPGPLAMVGFNRRFAPHVEKMKPLLDAVSEPKSFIMTMNAGRFRPTIGPRIAPSVAGGSSARRAISSI